MRVYHSLKYGRTIRITKNMRAVERVEVIEVRAKVGIATRVPENGVIREAAGVKNPPSVM